jgi:hypothetical protein
MANIYSDMSIRTRLLMSLAVVLSLSQFMACRHAIPNSPTSRQPSKASPNFSCYRHIYNASSCPWTFQATPQYANVWFNDDDHCATKCNNENGPCTLPPGCAISIQYTTSGGNIGGTLIAIDQNNTISAWCYNSPNPNSCPYISHGNSGPISLNDPVPGDLTARECTFQ